MSDGPESDRTLFPARRRTSAATALLAAGIVAATGVLYGGLLAGGDAWPVFVVLSCAAPLILLGLISIARWLACLVGRASGRQDSVSEGQDESRPLPET
jgi:hypothetical protein